MSVKRKELRANAYDRATRLQIWLSAEDNDRLMELEAATGFSASRLIRMGIRALSGEPGYTESVKTFIAAARSIDK